MFERFTPEARQAIVLAQQETVARGDLQIDLHHVLIGVLESPGDPLGATLESVGLSAPAARAAVAELLGPGIAGASGRREMTDPVRWLLELTLREALALGDRHIGTEHMMLALMFEPHGTVLEVILALQSTPHRVSEAVAAQLGQPVPTLKGRRGLRSGRQVMEGRGARRRR